jgi:DtxR family transcriptional regulator, Mn-dependent transcriptional regulator
METKLSQPMENYLRTIRCLEIAKGTVRSADVAIALGVSRPSAHTAITRLAECGLVRHARYASVELTEPGRKAADRILEKHDLAQRLFAEITKARPNMAQTEICAMERLNHETLASLVELLTPASDIPCS